MRVSLTVLAFGTLTTWLLAGGFSQLLASTLPFHHLEAEPTLTMVAQIFLAPTTWIALGVIATGLRHLVISHTIYILDKSVQADA